ncbi:cadherin-like beta sandwich domain-containing protein [Ectobacillus sp. sgz5001026]|uniref:cadherin-like beta sandwich domain-containing protein n=1 Tax=Ectobacillus sp. sgz5001026 TaxID=3242473 RepID=UPI0036D3187E
MENSSVRAIRSKLSLVLLSICLLVFSITPWNPVVKEVKAAGSQPTFETFIGNGQLNYPYGVAVNSAGYLYVSDAGNNRIVKFDQNGNFVKEITGFHRPYGLVIDKADNIYVSEATSDTIRKLDSSDTIVGQPWGGSGSADGQLSWPMGLAIDAENNIYVGDSANNRIQKFNSDGVFLAKWGVSGSGNGEFNIPSGVVVDSKGNIYVSDTANNRIQKFSTDGTFITSWGTQGLAEGQFSEPYGLTIDTADHVYVGDYSNNRIQVFNADGTFITMWGSTGNGDGQFSGPLQLAFHNSTIYVSEWYNSRISVFNDQGLLSSNNANLTDIGITSGTLSPAFDKDTTSYTASVGNDVSSVQVTPVVADSTATVTVNGDAVASGAASKPINLNVGTNTITVEVTAQDGTKKAYTLTIERATSSNAFLSSFTTTAGDIAFNKDRTSYEVTVGNDVTTTKVTPVVADATASVTVNGVAVASGEASGAINLEVGTNTITTVVTAQDGTTKTYTITVERAASSNADLTNLTPSNGTFTFDKDTTSYTMKVGNDVTSTKITPALADPTASVTVNGVAVASGEASGAINLEVGTNTITTVVTAQDGTTKTYTITVERAASSNADLTNLTPSNGTFTFDKDTTSYTMKVGNDVTSTKITLALADPTAKVTVNGVTVASGEASGVIDLTVGKNTITVEVTAQDGTTKTYTITVERAAIQPSQNDQLQVVSRENQLPDTSTGIYNWMSVGVVFVLFGIAMRITRLRKNNL